MEKSYSIPPCRIGGNKFHAVDDSPPWAFPLDSVPVEQNTSRPPTTQANAIANYAPPKLRNHKKKRMGPGGIAFMVGGGTLMATGLAVLIAIRLSKFHAQRMKCIESNHSSLPSHPISAAKDVSSTVLDESLQIPPFNSSSLLGPRRLHFPNHKRTGEMSRRSFSERDRVSGRTKVYTVAEVQLATNSFSEDNLLGEGSLGPVYRAEFPDNKVLAVKNISMAGLSFSEEEKFLDVICTAARLKHPNIVALKGYCLEHGQHLVVYDYVRDLTLEDAIHSKTYKPLSWGLRLRIALGVALALDYLHSTFSPPVPHGNLKAANVLLDENLIPRVCDCGLAVLRPLTSNKVKTRASEIMNRDAGYSSPEHGQSGMGNTKSDIFAFGVLLLELLTGRKPFDGSRPREEQYLAKWACSRLHDSESLEQMVDQEIKRTFSSMALSRYADIISLCIQPVKEFRPQMSEVVDSLVSFSQKLNMSKSRVKDGTALDDPLESKLKQELITTNTESEPNSRSAETGSNWDNNEKNDNEQKYEPNAHALPTPTLILLCSMKILSSILNIMRSMKNMVFNIIHLLTLCLNHYSHIQENLMQLQQTLLNIFSSIIPVLFSSMTRIVFISDFTFSASSRKRPISISSFGLEVSQL
ncbi:hypothetical protein Lal_00027864 [Lupinus albus]|nr:hypothetical protein Lal_00027864 [Lupinus albus]